MCGIVGKFAPRITESDVDWVVAACAIQSNRGPDHSAVLYDGFAALGHSRLSILDLDARSHQPFRVRTADRDVWISFNGEIYNHREVRKKLKDFYFRTTSDTETLVAAFMRWGVECFDFLDGMWGVAIYDRSSRKLTLCRDRFGEKPLFFGRFKEEVMFASEMKAFVPLGDASVISEKNFDLAFRDPKYLAASNESLISGVRSLTPGCFIEFVLGGDSISSPKGVSKYWVFPDFDGCEDFRGGEAEDALEGRLVEAVIATAEADVPIANQLSGGLDSSLLCGILSRGSAKRSGAAFHFRFPESGRDEVGYAEEVARFIGLPLRVSAFNDALIDDLALLKFVYHQETVSSDLHFGLFENFRNISASGIKVVIDGNGADELFFGYAHMVGELRRQALVNSLLSISNDNVNSYVDLLACSHSFRGGSAINDFSLSSDMRYAVENAAKKPYECLERTASRLSAKEIRERALPTILWNWDRMSMASGVEVRLPFLTRSVAELALKLPLNSKVGAGYSKLILRKIAERYVPSAVAWRTNKFGFAFPFDQWFRGALHRVMCSSWHDFGLASYSAVTVDEVAWRPESIEQLIKERKDVLLWKVWQCAAIRFLFAGRGRGMFTAETKIKRTRIDV